MAQENNLQIIFDMKKEVIVAIIEGVLIIAEKMIGMFGKNNPETTGKNDKHI